MIEQVLLSSGSFDRVREIGGFGQPLHTLYPQIQAVLANELGGDAAQLLAEPVVDRAHNRIDWYTESDPERKPIVLSDLPAEQRQPILLGVQTQLQRGRELAERYATSGDPQRVQLAAMLKAALGSPTENDIFLVEDRPVLAHWGFTTDRPWEMGGAVRRSSEPPPLPTETSQDVAIPDVEMPELASSAASSASVTESPEQPTPVLEPASAPETPEPPSAQSAPPADIPASPPPLPPSALTASSEPGTATSLSDKLEPSPIGEHPGNRLWRYVVVGSWYFWSVVLLAVLLALGTFLWVSTQTSASLIAEANQAPPNVASDPALREAWEIEQALRAELEQRLIQLAEQRVRCPLPVDTERASATPRVAAPQGGDAATTVATDDSPRLQTGEKLEERAGDSASASRSHMTEAAGTERLSPVEPMSRDKDQPTPDPVASLAQTLEEELAGSRAAVGAPGTAGTAGTAGTVGTVRAALDASTSQLPVESTVQTDPTPEERQEFTNRLSATGAAIGEITATLLWNGNADLDLVVLCPSGEMLDYQNPQECGGTLNVDANTARDSLSDRPVENVFWPAGQAAPGTYRIIVRYAPRKDEQQPQPTSFQVRLIRNNQEKVFKGMAKPRKASPVTNFTVER